MGVAVFGVGLRVCKVCISWTGCPQTHYETVGVGGVRASLISILFSY